MPPADGIWTPVTPKDLPRKYAGHGWVFGVYTEFPSQRRDGLWYRALHFRNEARTQFGFQAWLGPDLPHVHVGKLATRIVMDRPLRESLFSEDASFPKLSKRH
ncbi:MAG: hypothetical protein JNG90_10275 [Planctomycetaceae bacterium]|nr:hypothetical protein [Planctomycetaceae bacterium]